MPCEDNIRSRILREADEAINGERAVSYGSAEENFGLVAAYWSAHLDKGICAADVAIMMSLLKLARLKTNATHWDSWMDVAGYAALGAEVIGGKSEG